MDASATVELPVSAALSFNCNIALRCPSEQEALHSIAVRLRLPFDPPSINVPFDSSVLSSDATSYARGLPPLPPISSPHMRADVRHNRTAAGGSSRRAKAAAPHMLAEAVRAVGSDVPAHVRTQLAAGLLRSFSPNSSARRPSYSSELHESEDFDDEFADSAGDASGAHADDVEYGRIRRADFVGQNILLHNVHTAHGMPSAAVRDRRRAESEEEGNIVSASYVHPAAHVLREDRATSESARIFVGLRCGAVIAMQTPTQREHAQESSSLDRTTAAAAREISTEQALVVALLARSSSSPSGNSQCRYSKESQSRGSTKFDREASSRSAPSNATILGYHRGAVTCVGYDETTRTVYTGSADGCLCIWDALGGSANTGSGLGTAGAPPRSSGYGAEPRSVRRRGSRSEDAQAIQFVEMVRRRALIQCVNAHDATVSDARHYACNMFTGSVDKTVKLWRRITLRKQANTIGEFTLCHIFCFSSWVRSIAFSGGSDKAQPLTVYVSDSKGSITVIVETVARIAMEDDVPPSIAIQQPQRNSNSFGTQFRVAKTCSISAAKDSIWDNRNIDALSTLQGDTSGITGPRAIMKLLSIEGINTIVTLGFDSVITLYEPSTMSATQCITLPTSSMALGSEKAPAKGRLPANKSRGDAHDGITRIVDVLFLPLSERLVILESNGHLLLWDMEACNYVCECIPRRRLHPRALVCADAVSRKQRGQRQLTQGAGTQHEKAPYEQDGFWIQTDRSVEHVRIEECFIARRRKGHTGCVIGIASPQFGRQKKAPLTDVLQSGAQDPSVVHPKSLSREVDIRNSVSLGAAYVSMSVESTICMWNERLDILQVENIDVNNVDSGSPLLREQSELSCMLYCSEWGGVMSGHTDGTIRFTCIDAGGLSLRANPGVKHRVHANTVSDACILFMTQSIYHSNTHLATVSFDGFLGIWTHPEKPSIRRLAKARVSFSELVAVAFCELNQTVLVGDNTGVLSTWSVSPSGLVPACVLVPMSLPTGDRLTQRIPFRPLPVMDVSSRNSRSDPVFWDGPPCEVEEAPSEYTCAAAHQEAISAIAVDGNFALSGSEDGEIHLWNLSTRTCVRTYRIKKNAYSDAQTQDRLPLSSAGNDEVRCMILLENAECMLVGTRLGFLYVFDLDAETPIAMQQHVCEITSLCAAHSSVQNPAHPAHSEKCASPDRLSELLSTIGTRGVIVGDSSGALSYAAFNSFVKISEKEERH